MANVTNNNTNSVAAFFDVVRSPVQFRLYLLKTLPAALFSGVRVEHASAVSCSISVPYKWFTRNPFRSTYFACLSMAAEMSTGLLAMAHVRERKPSVAMLVTAVEGTFHKKAVGRTVFTCHDGDALSEVIDTALATGAPQSFKAKSEGYNEQNELVAVFWITWSFKVRQASKRSGK